MRSLVGGTGYSTDLLDINQPEQTTTEPISQLVDSWYEIQRSINVLEMLARFSESTGEFVKLFREYDFLPVLIGDDNRPIYLFLLVEVLDELVDYNKIREELPTLSHSQIDGAISFLRKIAQFNLHGLDIDEVIDEMESEDHELLSELKKGLTDQEIARVLHHDQ